MILFLALAFTTSIKVFGQRKCAFQIDTAKILSNRNLDKLLLEFQSGTFKTTNNKNDIPRFIKRQLNCLTHGFLIANPGKPYEATDVFTGNIFNKLPSRQLVFLAKSDNMLVMTYLKGGRGLSRHLLFIKFNGKKITDFWSGSCLNGMDTKEGIINNINYSRSKKWELNTNMVNLYHASKDSVRFLTY